MAERYFKVTVTDGNRVYHAVGSARSNAANPAALAQRKAMNAIVEKFPELDGDSLHVTDVAETNPGPTVAYRVPTDEETDQRRRETILWRLAQRAKAEPMAELTARVEKYSGNRRYASVAEALAWYAESAMKEDIERAWAETILNVLRDEGATYFDAHPSFEMSGGYRVGDEAKFDEVIERFTRETLKKGLRIESTSTSAVHNLKAQLERDVAARVYEFLTEGGFF